MNEVQHPFKSNTVLQHQEWDTDDKILRSITMWSMNKDSGTKE
jgi:hypothetical protein